MARQRPADLRVGPDLVIPAGELHVETVRSGGPGGQNVNRRRTQVQLRFGVRESACLDESQRRRLQERLASRLNSRGELVIRASRNREQARNLAEARERLARLLEHALRPIRARRPTRPTRASRERRLEEKRRGSERKQARSLPPE